MILAAGVSTMLAAQTPAPAKPTPAAGTATAAPKPQAGPPAPQSRHFPILLIATGTSPNWSARIGMKGLELLDREGYPPINLVPGEVEQDAEPMTWTYHAKDADTGADVSAQLVRDTCTVGTSEVKYSFKVQVNHAQIGSLTGCARMEPDQFPEFKQKNLDDDDPDKKKPGPPPITNFKAPTSYAYVASTGKVVLRRSGVTHVVPASGEQLSVSHDGKRVLFTKTDGGQRSIWLYDVTSGRAAEWLGGGAQSAFWSPDDTRIAFLKMAGGAWQVWTAAANNPQQGTEMYNGNVTSLDGWSDAHTIVASDANNFYWIGDTGNVASTVLAKDIYGDQFSRSTSDYVRVNPMNTDLLLVSAAISRPAAGTVTDAQTGMGAGFFLYELRAKRRVLLSPPEILASEAEWSQDGVQIFFTARQKSGTVIDRIFWDGSEVKRYAAGSDLVAGE